MPNYTTNAELKELTLAYRHARRRMNPEKLKRFLYILGEIAGGVWGKFEYTDSLEDFVQDCITKILGKAVFKVDVDRNIFSYFTTVACNLGVTARSHAIRDRNAERDHLDALIEKKFEDEMEETAEGEHDERYITRNSNTEDVEDVREGKTVAHSATAKRKPHLSGGRRSSPTRRVPRVSR